MMWGFTLITLLVIFLALVLVFRINRRRAKDADSPPRETPPPAIQAPRPTRHSRSLHGALYRYQARSHIQRGDEFYKMFIDGSWKWRGQQRYAGVHVEPRVPTDTGAPMEIKINTGHYFARHPSAARDEILHYTSEEGLKEFSLFEVEADLDNLLDLTDLQVIRTVADATFVDRNTWDIVSDLIAVDTGGGQIPAVFGYYGSRHGYTGILSFSARAIHKRAAERLRESQYHDELVEDMDKRRIIRRMQKQARRQCVVVFSGAVLTRVIKRYRFDDGAWENNPYFAWSEERISTLWKEWGTDYQATQGRVLYVPSAEPKAPAEPNH